MIILGLVGEIGSGKTTLTNYLKERYHARTFRFSDIMRDVLIRLHLEPSRTNLQDLSTVLRQQFGDDIFSKVMAADVVATTEEFVVVEGIRRPSDTRYLQMLSNFTIVAVEAAERTRFERITGRTEKPDDQQKTWEQFQKDGAQESESEITAIKTQAKYVVDNNGTIKDTFAQIEQIIAKLK